MTGLNAILGTLTKKEETAETTKKPGEQQQVPTHDISLIHEAIPFLPVPLALICLLLNILVPGTGKEETVETTKEPSEQQQHRNQ